jgi:hypothetical protein
VRRARDPRVNVIWCAGRKPAPTPKRTARGRFKEMDDVGRSEKADKARKAKKKVRSGYGDQGDERPKSGRRTRR